MDNAQIRYISFLIQPTETICHIFYMTREQKTWVHKSFPTDVDVVDIIKNLDESYKDWEKGKIKYE